MTDPGYGWKVERAGLADGSHTKGEGKERGRRMTTKLLAWATGVMQLTSWDGERGMEEVWGEGQKLSFVSVTSTMSFCPLSRDALRAAGDRSPEVKGPVRAENRHLGISGHGVGSYELGREHVGSDWREVRTECLAGRVGEEGPAEEAEGASRAM